MAPAAGQRIQHHDSRHEGRHDRKTGKLLKYTIVILIVALAAGAVFLATWDIPAPTHPVEKVIPNDRFNR